MSEFDDFMNPGENTENGFRSDTDLSGMDVESAKEYVISYITSLKQLQKQMTELGRELQTWQERVLFARGRGRTDLAGAAEQRVRELQARLGGLQQEEQDLARKVKELIENFKKLKAGFSFSIDADKLLAELNMIVGEKDEVAEKFKEEETLAELERMKARLNSEKNGKPGNGNS